MDNKNELFEKTSVPKAYFKFAMPVVMSMVVSLIYNMVDTYFIARTGNTSLVAGVALGAPVFTLMIAIGDVFGLGGSSVISRLFGQKRDDDGKRLSVFCFWGAVFTGIFVTAVMMIFRLPILSLLGATSDTLKYASDYYIPIVLGAPFIILVYTPGNQLRTEGFSVASMVGSVLGAVINIILDPIFISSLNMGAKGAAIATVIGNICTDIFYVWFLMKKSKRLSLDIRLLKISKKELLDIFSIGIPASITNIMQSVGITITNRFLLAYGTTCVAAMGIVMKVNMIAVLVLVGFAFGAQPLIGYNYGARNFVRLKSIMKFSYTFMCSLALVLTVIVFLTAKPLIMLFMNNQEIISVGTPMLHLQVAGTFFVAIILVSTCTFQSTGKAIGALLLSISRQGVIFVVVIITMSKFFGYNGVIASQAIADVLTALMAVIIYRVSLHKEIQKGLLTSKKQ